MRNFDGKSWAPVVFTLLYWAWESRTAGNIRVDLLLIYPLLFGIYLYFLWPKFKFVSIPISLALMALNYGFMAFSYNLFNKYPG